MKISKSKQGLASIISENGGWRDGAEWSIQDRDKNIEFMTRRPEYMKYVGAWYAYASRIGSFKIDNLLPNFHQTILSRAEYFHLYPAPDADGWIEWNGGDCPVGEGDRIDVKFSDGDEFFDVGSKWGWDVDAGACNVIAYRLHKQQPKPEFCESVMRSIPEPEAQPTIEQLAADYRNAKDFAERKQKEADDAKDGADARLKALEIAAEDLGFKIEPITTKQDGL